MRWATRAACAAIALGLAFACAPILGIEDVSTPTAAPSGSVRRVRIR